MSKNRVLLCVDMGTTRTRVWLTLGGRAIAQTSADFGVRDVSIGKDKSWLRAQMVELLRDVSTNISETPEAVLAAGMITSNLGLQEVPHVEAPVSGSELAAKIYADEIALAADKVLPLLLIPGVRTGRPAHSLQSALEMDLMRGEETLCIGLMANGRLSKNGVLLNLGSHWKTIWTNAQMQIARSRTTLTGEMIHVAQTHTLIASSLPQEAPRHLDMGWMQSGFEEAQRSGLGRALFAIRLLHLGNHGTPEQRLAFLYGAFVQTELMRMREFADSKREILVVGSQCVAEGWKHHAEAAGIRCTVLHETERQKAYLEGLLSLYGCSVFA